MQIMHTLSNTVCVRPLVNKKKCDFFVAEWRILNNLRWIQNDLMRIRVLLFILFQIWEGGVRVLGRGVRGDGGEVREKG